MVRRWLKPYREPFQFRNNLSSLGEAASSAAFPVAFLFLAARKSTGPSFFCYISIFYPAPDGLFNPFDVQVGYMPHFPSLLYALFYHEGKYLALLMMNLFYDYKWLGD